MKSITIMRTMTGKYFASVLVEDGLTAPEKPAQISEDVVNGVDLGLRHYLSDSNGRKEDSPGHLKKALASLRRKHRKLSSKEKGSRRRQKARFLVAKAHERVTSCGGKTKAMPLSVRSWACSSCGSVHDRDLNAATNIKDEGIRILLAEGLSVTARGGRRNPIKRLVVAPVETRSLAIHGGSSHDLWAA